MTACSKWRDELLDAALGRAASQDLQAHVEKCAACAAEFSKLQAANGRLDVAMAGLRAPEGPSAVFQQRMVQAMAAELAQMHPPRWPMGLRPAVLLAAAVVLIIGGTLLMVRGKAQRESFVPVGDIAEWRSPTETLLRSPAEDFLRNTPRLAEVYYPLDRKADATPRPQRRKQ